MSISKITQAALSYKFIEEATNIDELAKNIRIHERTAQIGSTEKKISIVISAQFSEQNFTHTLRTYGDRKIEVINFRKEPYALIEGSAVGLSDEDMEELDALTSEELIAQMHDAGELSVHVGVRKIKEFIDGIEYARYEDDGVRPFDVYTAIMEEQFVKKMGVKYTNLPIPNHAVKEAFQDPTLVDEIVATLREAFEESDFIYLHCQGGKSRSPLAAILGIIMLDGQDKSFEKIKQELAVYPYEAKKFEQHDALLRRFHQYINECDPSQVTYSEWLSSRR